MVEEGKSRAVNARSDPITERGETKPTADSRSSRPIGLCRMDRVDSTADGRSRRPSGSCQMDSLEKSDTSNTPWEKKKENNEEREREKLRVTTK